MTVMTARPMKRARIRNSRSVFLKHFDEGLAGLSNDERSFLEQLCRDRELEQLYYEGACVLFMRCKHHLSDHNQQLTMLACLHVTAKFCGPPWTAHKAVKLDLAQKLDTSLNSDKLCRLELDVLHALNWTIF